VAEDVNPLHNNGDTGFRPLPNGFSTNNFYDVDIDPEGHCWGMVAFAAWYWEYKKSDVCLSKKYFEFECEEKSVINKTHHLLKWCNTAFIDVLHKDAAYVANAIMVGIDLQGPQILGLFRPQGGPGHAVLVYKYVKNSDSSVTFYIYNPDPPRDDTITYENGSFKPFGSYNIYRFVGGLFSLSSYESIYNLEMMPIIDNMSPTGTVTTSRPTISAVIKHSDSPYYRAIDINKIFMELDGNPKSPTEIIDSGSVVTISYTPDSNLNPDIVHTVSVTAYDVEGVGGCSEKWTFNIVLNCTNIAGNWSGTVGDAYSIILSLSQDGCDVTGTIVSPDSCPYKCGLTNGDVTGSVNVNNFSITIHSDPFVDCKTCQVSCYGTDQGIMTVNGDSMSGIITTEDCEDHTFIDIPMNLSRSSSISQNKTIVKTPEKRSGLMRSSILSFKSGVQ